MKKVKLLGITILFALSWIFSYNYSLGIPPDSSERRAASSFYTQDDEPWSSYTYNNIIIKYPSDWQADYTQPNQVGFHNINPSEGVIIIGVLAVPIEPQTKLVDMAAQIYGSVADTNIIEEFTPSIVGGHEAAIGVISPDNQSFLSKLTLIKFDDNTLYMLQFIAPKDNFSSIENIKVMNKVIASVSFKD